MTTIASGVGGEVRYKKQSAEGTLAGASGGKQLRRLGCTLNLEKTTYRSREKTTSKKPSDIRHGLRTAPGELSGELSPGTYADFFAAALRKAFVSGASTGALTNVTAAAGPPGTFTRAAGSFITDGIKVGDIGRWTGWTTTGLGNNARNYRVTSLTDTVMTVGSAASGAAGMPELVGAKAAGDSVTFTVVGKKTWDPPSGHTKDLFTFERWFPEIAQSLRFLDVLVSTVRISMPAEGLCTVSFGLVSKDGSRGTAEYFTTPTAVTTTTITSAVGGFIRAAGVDVAVLTSLELNIALNPSGVPVAFANTIPTQNYGISGVTGTIVAGFIDGAMWDVFSNETEFSIAAMLTTGSGIAADFLSFVMSRCKLTGNAIPDDDGQLFATMPFESLEDLLGSASTNTERTHISIQDSAA